MCIRLLGWVTQNFLILTDCDLAVYLRTAMEKEEFSEKLLRWKLNKLEEQNERTMKSWKEEAVSNSQVRESLETTIQALQGELEAQKKRLEELKTELDETQRDNKRLVRDKTALLVDRKNKEKIHEGELRNLDESSAAYKEHQNNVLLYMQGDFDEKLALQKEEADRALKEQAGKYECEVLKMKKQLYQMAEENKRVVQQLTEKYEALEKEMNLKSTAELESRFMCEKLEMKLIKQAKIIKERRDLTKTVSELKDTLVKKNENIATLEREVMSLKHDRNTLGEELKAEKTNFSMLSQVKTLLKASVKRLEDEKEKEVSMLNNTKIELKEAMQAKSNLIEKLGLESSKMKANEKEMSKLRAKLRKLETCVLRYKGDIQACMSDIENPKKLRSRIMEMKIQHIDTDECEKMDENTREAFQDKLNSLKTKLGVYERIQQSNFNEKRNILERLEKGEEDLAKTRHFFIKLLNEKVMEVEKLKKDLHNATKPKRVKSWVNKKVLGITKVIPQVQPALYPEDWNPLGCPDDSITSSLQTCVDDVVSSPWQPPPCTGGNIVHVRPFVDDGMPRVDI